MMKKIYLLIVALAVYLPGCLSHGVTNGLPDEDTEETETVSTVDLDETIHDGEFVFNDDLLREYIAQNRLRKITSEEYERFRIPEFDEAPDRDQTVYLLDSIRPDHKNYYLRFILCTVGENATVWMATYRPEDDRYMDSRKIHEREQSRWDPEYFSFTDTRLTLPDDRMESMLPGGMVEELVVPVAIWSDGRFEEFPECPYSQDTVAIGSCVPNALDGKFPAGETWTGLDFDELGGIHSYFIETRHPSADHLGSPNTLFYFPGGREIWCDILFKGRKENFRPLKTVTERLEPSDALYMLLLHAAPDHTSGEDWERGVENMVVFEADSAGFRLAEYVEKTEHGRYVYLLGMNSDLEITLLANRCIERYQAFSMDEEILLTVRSTSCGEGASSLRQLYRMEDNRFELVFQAGRTCD